MPRQHLLFFYIYLAAILVLNRQTLFSQEANLQHVTAADSTRANEYFDKAKKLYEAAQYDSSTLYFEKAKVIFNELVAQHDVKEIWEKYIKCNNYIGTNLHKRGNYDEAMQHLKIALKFGLNKFGVHHPLIATSYNEIGNLYREVGEYDKALTSLHKALDIRIDLFGERSSEIAATYNYIGIVYRVKGDLQNALDFYKKSLSIKREIYGEKHRKVALMYNNIGNVSRDSGNLDEALTFYFQAKDILHSDTSRKNQYVIATINNNIGEAYAKKGNFDQALDMFERSLRKRIELLGENQPVVAAVYNNIGMIYKEMGDYDRALEYYQKSLRILIEKYGKNHRDVTAILNNIANIYEAKGEYDKSLDLHHQNLQTRIALFGENNFLVAWSYHNAGVVYLKKADYKKALEYSIKALTIRLQVYNKNHPEVAWSYNNIGGVYVEMGKHKKALEFLQKALSLRIKIFGEKNPAVAYTLKAIGAAYLKQNEFVKALDYYQKAIISLVPNFNESNIYVNPQLINVSSEIYLLNTLADKAKALKELSSLKAKDLKDIQMSLFTSELASKLIDKLRHSYEAERSKLFLGETVLKIYDRAVETALELYELTKDDQYKEIAFLLAEKSKATVLLGALQESKAKIFADIPDSLLTKERNLKIDLAYYRQAILEEKQKKEDQDKEKINKFENKYFSLKLDYESLIDTLENVYPSYFDLKYQTQSVSIKEVRENVIKENQILIEYFVAEGKTYVWLVTKNQFFFKSIESSREKLYRDIIQVSSFFREGQQTKAYLANNGDSKQQIREDTDGTEINSTKLHELYQTILEPVVKNKLKEGSELIIIPDDILSYLPFEMLVTEVQDGKARYLVEDYAISYSASASLLNPELRKTSTPKKELLAVGNPNFDPENYQNLAHSFSELFSSIFRDGKWIPLPYSEKEVKSIAGRFKDHKLLIGEQATEENVVANAPDYRYLHIATHYQVDDRQPMFSKIILAQNNNNTTEDGFLHTYEVFNLNLNADLVVLSACNTALGKFSRGEGLMGISRAFMYAGVPSLVVSLWQVEDESTAYLMSQFYKHLTGGDAKNVALQKAKIDLIKSDLKKNDPFYWAPFVLIGDWH